MNTSAQAVILMGPNGGPVVQRVTPLDRLKARVRARALDRALASGEPPEGTTAAALRARRLTDLSNRRELAFVLRRLVRRAPCASSALSAAPVVRTRVVSAGEALERLADELAAPGPVRAGGVALVRLLVTDGVGPLYNPHSRDDLAGVAERAIDALRL
jgi:hypothetical protein